MEAAHIVLAELLWDEAVVSHCWSIGSHQPLLSAWSQTSSKEAVIEKDLSMPVVRKLLQSNVFFPEPKRAGRKAITADQGKAG